MAGFTFPRLSFLALTSALLATCNPIYPRGSIDPRTGSKPALAQPSTTCNLTTTFPIAPICPNGCCGWLFGSDTADQGEPLCGGKSGNTTTSFDLPSTPTSTSWFTAGCPSLKSTMQSQKADFVITNYTKGVFYTLADHQGCSVQVAMDQPPNPDSIHIASGDVEEWITSGTPVTKGGKAGAKGSTYCWAYPVTWRLVPSGFSTS